MNTCVGSFCLVVTFGIYINYSFCLSVQAESALDQMDWIEKITGVIASLLSSQAPERVIFLRCYMFSHLSFVIV